MLQIQSKFDGMTKSLFELEQLLKPHGFSIASNWDYNHGYLDYKIADEPSYVFLRVPFEAVQGSLDEQGVVVQLGSPFILAHQYQSGLDDYASTGAVLTGLSQFSEPIDSDAYIQAQYGVIGKALVEEIEFYIL